MRDGITAAIGRAAILDAAQAVLAAREERFKDMGSVVSACQLGVDRTESKEFGLGGVILPDMSSRYTRPMRSMLTVVHVLACFTSLYLSQNLVGWTQISSIVILAVWHAVKQPWEPEATGTFTAAVSCLWLK